MRWRTMSARVIKSGVARGHLQIHVGLTRDRGGRAAPLNRALLHAYVAAFREAAELYAIEAQPDLNSALRIPGMLSTGDEEELGEDVTKAVLEAAAEAVAVAQSQSASAKAPPPPRKCGSAAATSASWWRAWKRSAPARSPAFQKRLREKLADLLHGAGIEPQRLAQEAAILADRSDIAEELMRLRTHAAQLETMLDRRGRSRQTAGFSVAGNESRRPIRFFRRPAAGRSGPDHHRSGAERQIAKSTRSGSRA